MWVTERVTWVSEWRTNKFNYIICVQISVGDNILWGINMEGQINVKKQEHQYHFILYDFYKNWPIHFLSWRSPCTYLYLIRIRFIIVDRSVAYRGFTTWLIWFILRISPPPSYRFFSIRTGMYIYDNLDVLSRLNFIKFLQKEWFHFISLRLG